MWGRTSFYPYHVWQIMRTRSWTYCIWRFPRNELTFGCSFQFDKTFNTTWCSTLSLLIYQFYFSFHFSYFSMRLGRSASFNTLMSSVQLKMMCKEKNEIFLDDRKLDLVKGQRGKELLLLNGYTFSRNLVVDKSTYWCCRHRTVNKPPCHARARTQEKENGLHTIIISQPNHNHKPTLRPLHRTIDQPSDDYEWILSLCKWSQ